MRSSVVLTSNMLTLSRYMTSISSKLSFGFLSRYSLRGKPLNEVHIPLKISWRVFFWNAAFWSVTIVVKVLFDFYFIIQPLADAVRTYKPIFMQFPQTLKSY